jgi:hypothetical protein
MMRDCSGDYGAQRPTGTGALHTIGLTATGSAELETMATSEEAEESIHYDSNTAAVLTDVCLSCVTDVSNCLLGVCFFHMNTIQQLMTLITRKTDLI